MNIPKVERIGTAIIVVFGFSFALFAMYQFFQTTSWFDLGAVFAGTFTAFLQLDRNVYRKRVLGLQKAILQYDSSLIISRSNYTEYTIMEDPDDTDTVVVRKEIQKD